MSMSSVMVGMSMSVVFAVMAVSMASVRRRNIELMSRVNCLTTLLRDTPWSDGRFRHGRYKTGMGGTSRREKVGFGCPRVGADGGHGRAGSTTAVLIWGETGSSVSTNTHPATHHGSVSMSHRSLAHIHHRPLAHRALTHITLTHPLSTSHRSVPIRYRASSGRASLEIETQTSDPDPRSRIPSVRKGRNSVVGAYSSVS